MQNAGSTNSTFTTLNGITADEIRIHVQVILASPAFRSSKRSYRFLNFIVEQVLEGRSSTIKERTLATEVFDRSAAWDSNGEDTIVRVGAREVRKRLAQFYASPEGAAEALRIDLPLGSYVPDFKRNTPAQSPPVERPGEQVLSTEGRVFRTRPLRNLRLWAAGSVCAILLVLSGVRFGPALMADDFDRFWDPFFHAANPLLVAVPAPLLYFPSTHAWKLHDAKFGAPQKPVVEALNLPSDALHGSDFVPMPNQFLAFGDAVAAGDVQALLARHSKEARLRLATKVEFADLRDTPSIMIGGFTNHWTIELTERFRYHFGYDDHWMPGLLDSSQPSRAWSINRKQEDGTSPEDYILIARLLNAPSGTPILIGAGVAQFGTEAAGRFLSDRASMDAILQQVKGDWRNHNVELVLYARVIGNSPAAPRLVASYVW